MLDTYLLVILNKQSQSKYDISPGTSNIGKNLGKLISELPVTDWKFSVSVQGSYRPQDQSKQPQLISSCLYEEMYTGEWR